MPNTIEYASIFQQKLDMQMLQGLATKFMENTQGLIYTGGNTIKIPKLSLTGLNDYSRATGYPTNGAVTFEYETKTFEKDRSQMFNIDRNDVDETNFVLSAGMVMSEFQRTKVIPEVDAYRLSKCYAVADAGGKTVEYTPAVATILQTLESDIDNIKDVIGSDVPLVCYISVPTMTVLKNADKIEKKLDVGNFTRGEINTNVTKLNDVILVPVSSARMKTAYTFGTDGFAPAVGSADMNYVITPLDGVMGITKTESMKIITPEVNQSYDGWSLPYRKYHTCIIPDNKVDGIFVSKSPVA